jgi:hypothetical protein
MISTLSPESRSMAETSSPGFMASRAALVAITRMDPALFSRAVLAKAATASAVLATGSGCSRRVS